MYRSIGEGTNMSILSGMSDINNMQLKLNQESVRNQFKPKMIGGTEMSGQASENTYKVEENSKNDNRDISNEIISIRKRLKEETEEKKRLQADMDEVLKELNSYIAECNNKDLIIKTMGEKQSSQNIKLQNEIHSIEEEKKNTEKQLAEYNIKIKKINDYSSGLEETNAKYLKEIENLKKDKEKILWELKEEKEKSSASKDNGFKEDIISIYKKIESLVDEADKYVMTNDELKKKLDDEKQRADKAENNLNEFMKSVSNLKEKFESEQRIIESQFKAVLEKQYNFQAEINNCLANYNK
jgi:chromosome segregation ATPase